MVWCVLLIKKSKIPPLPPGPPGLPVVGNLPFIEHDFHHYFAKLFTQVYGMIFELKLGSKICIQISSSSLAKQVLKEQDAIFANRCPPAAASVTLHGLHNIPPWVSNGPEWRQLCKVFIQELISILMLAMLCVEKRFERW